MSAPSLKIPKYRQHKAKGLAAVTIDGKHVYLGPYDSPESREKYHQVIAAWISARGAAPLPDPEQVKGFWGISNLVEAYLQHAKIYYSRDGKITSVFWFTVNWRINPWELVTDSDWEWSLAV